MPDKAELDAGTPSDPKVWGHFAVGAGGQLRELVWSTVTEVSPLHEDELRTLPSPGVEPGEIAHAARSKNGFAFAIREARAGSLVAYSVALPEAEARLGGKPTALYFFATAVDSPYQRHGLASRLAKAVIEEARQRGFRELSAIVSCEGRQSGADAFLYKLGARITRLMPTPAEASDLADESYEQIRERYRLTNAELRSIQAGQEPKTRLPEFLRRYRHAMLEMILPLTVEPRD